MSIYATTIVFHENRTQAQILADARTIARERYDETHPLYQPFLRWVAAEHLEHNGMAEPGIGTAAMRMYYDAKEGRGFTPRFPIRWPIATTDGSRADLRTGNDGRTK